MASAGGDENQQSVDFIIEAAAVAQAAVAQRDKELSDLRAELAETRLKLAKASSAKDPPRDYKTAKKSSLNASNAKMEIVKTIQAYHQALLSSTRSEHFAPRPSQSTPFRNLYLGARGSLSSDQDMATLLTILKRNNVQDLPSFSGDNKREWPNFEEEYKAITLEGRFSSKENVARLIKALKGEPYQMVSDRLRYSADADAIMDLLRIMFGRAEVLVHDLSSDLLSLPKLFSKCDPKLRLWAVKINGFVADLKSMNREEDLSNGYVITNLASRLGAGLYQEWQKKKLCFSKVNMQKLAEFLIEKVIDPPPELLRPGIEQKKFSSTGVGKTSRVLVHQPISECRNELCCKYNKNQHALFQCEEFLAMTLFERQTLAKERSICFTCLDAARHQWKVCAKKRSCGTGGCSRRHHPLLHMPSNSTKSELRSVAVPFVPQPHIHSSDIGADVTIMFKIVPIRIFGSGNLYVDTYAFLDDGSSLSIIEEELFHELGLYGKPERLTLQWTKGVSLVEDCKKTAFSVSSVANRKRYSLKNVYSVKNSDVSSQSVDVTHLKALYPHLRGLPLVELVDARPKILLGLDQAKFLLGHAQRHGKDEDPHTLNTLLGWIVYGRSAPSLNVSCLERGAKPSMKLMFHEAIRDEEDLHELVLHHFTTEEFGVMPPKGELVSREVSRSFDIMERTLKLVGRQYEIGVLWSSSEVELPDSFAMAFKRLIALEKLLKKNPQLLE